MQTLHLPHLNRTVRLGRIRPVAHPPHLKLARYLPSTLPTPPEELDFTTAPGAAAVLADIMANDELGDCGIAGYFHNKGVITANNGAVFHANRAQVLALYGAVGGYRPGYPSTDNGIVLTDLLHYLMAHPDAGGAKITGYAAVDPTNEAELKVASWLSGGAIYMGLDLPASYEQISGSGFTWDVAGAGAPNAGHCVVAAAGYNAKALRIATWGMVGDMTYGAVAKYMAQSVGGECWVFLTSDQIAKGKALAPNGLDWLTLERDLDSIGGNIPLPPPPVPTPAPPAPVTPPAPAANTMTLAQAQAALGRGWDA